MPEAPKDQQERDYFASLERDLTCAKPQIAHGETPEDELFCDLYAALEPELADDADRATVADMLVERDGAKILAACAATEFKLLMRWSHIGALVEEARAIFEARKESTCKTKH